MNTLSLNLLLLLSICSALDMTKFHGPIVFTLAFSCYDSLISSDALYFYCSQDGEKRVEVFKNSGSGFEPHAIVETE